MYEYFHADGRVTVPLTRKRLVTAALGLVDEGHEEVLSMRMLAKRVDRQVSSLYNHVENRAELIELMRARVVEGVDVQVFDTEAWDEAMARWARSYFRAMAEHPYLSQLLASTPPQDPSTMKMYEVVAAALVRAGWPIAIAVAVLRTVESLIIGSVQDVSGPVSALHSGHGVEGLATLTEALSEENMHTNTATAAFEIGIDAIIAGLKAHPQAPKGA